MITIDGLKQLGADTESGVTRCMGMEDFYIKLVNMALDSDEYGKLRSAVEARNLKEGFEHAHALKGMLGNVSLTNLLNPVLEMTEALRHEEDRDYSALLDQMDEELGKLKALRD